MITTNPITLESLGLAFYSERAHASCDDGWPCVVYRVAFVKGTHAEHFEYRYGVGHFRLPPGRYSAGEQAKLAFRAKRVRPIDGLEILNCLCRDAMNLGEGFEEWAAEFGYDTDSRKAEAIYNACLANRRKLRKLLTPAQIESVAAIDF